MYMSSALYHCIHAFGLLKIIEMCMCIIMHTEPDVYVLGPARTADDLLNLDQVLIQLRPVHSKWKEIAQALRVPITFIEQLEEAFSMDASSRMTEITDHWMRECSGKPTWRELADALKTIGEVKLAQQFMQIYETGIKSCCVSLV